MNKFYLLLLFVAVSFATNAQISGSTSVCPGYRYTYTANVPGAVSYTWSIPNGWTIVGSQTNAAVTVNVNQAVGDICAIGFTAGNAPIDTACLTAGWGINNTTWTVNANHLCPCWYCPYLFTVQTQPDPAANCGSGIPNPKVVYAIYEQSFSFGNYIALANGFTPVSLPNSPTPDTLLIYKVDTTLGMANAQIISGNGTQSSLPHIVQPIYPPGTLTLHITDTPLCITDTFMIFIDTAQATALGTLSSYAWTSSDTNLQLFNQTPYSTMAVFSDYAMANVSYTAQSATGCVYNALIARQSTVCMNNAFALGDTNVCKGYVYTYTVFMAGASYYNWDIPNNSYFWTDSTSNSIKLAIDASVPEFTNICAKGYTYDSLLLDSICMTIGTPPGGGGGLGGDSIALVKDSIYQCGYYLYSLSFDTFPSTDTTSTGGGGGDSGCGVYKFQNPNLYWVVIDSLWPAAPFPGSVFAQSQSPGIAVLGFLADEALFSGGQNGLTAYAYFVDTTFTRDSLILIGDMTPPGGGDPGGEHNSEELPGQPVPVPYPITVDPVPCIGDTVLLTIDFSGYIGPLDTLYNPQWSSNVPEFQIIQQGWQTAVAVLTAAPPDLIHVTYESLTMPVDTCQITAAGDIAYSYCNPASFSQFDSLVCPGYIDSYTADIPGANTFAWTLPSGWYIVGPDSGASIQAAVNISIGDLCVTGYDDNGVEVGSVCQAVNWSAGGVSWSIDAQTDFSGCPPNYIITVTETDCGVGGCNGYPNPNVAYAVYDQDNYFYGIANPSVAVPPAFEQEKTVFVIQVDFGNGETEISGGYCGPTLASLELGGFYPEQFPLIQSPSPACIGDTFLVQLDPSYAGWFYGGSFASSNPNVWLSGNWGEDSVTVVVTNASSLIQIGYEAYDVDGCLVEGIIDLNFQNCTPGFTQFDSVVCANSIYQYSVEIAGASTFVWTLPVGWYIQSGNGTNSIQVLTSDFTGDVCVSGYSGSNLVGSLCNTVTGMPGPPVILSTNPTLACLGEPMTITISSDVPFTIFNWYSSLSFVDNGPDWATVIVEDLSDTQFGVEIITDNGCSGYGEIQLNYIDCGQALNFAANDTALCANSCIAFTNLSQDSAVYQWSFPGGNPSTSTDTNPINICYATAGDYDVTLYAANNGTTDTLVMTNYIHVYANPQASVTPTTVIAACNFTGSLDLNVLSGTIPYTFEWSNGQTVEDLAELTAGIYDVTVTDANGCSVATSINIIDSITFDVSLSPSGPLTSCYMAYNVTLTATPLPNTAYYFRLGGFDSTSVWVQYNDGNTFQPNTNGNNQYWVIGVDTVTGCVDTSSLVEVMLIELPDPQVSVEACVNQTILLTTTTTDPTHTYQWLLDGIDITGATNTTYTAAQSGTYAIRVMDSCGVSKISDAIYFDETCFTGFIVLVLKESNINIYPNPNDGNFNLDAYISNGGNETIKIQIVNVLGQVVYEKVTQMQNGLVEEKLNAVDVSADGIYTLRITSSQGRTIRSMVTIH